MLTAPADRRLAAAWEGAAQPAHGARSAIVPFSGGPQTPSRAPAIDWIRADVAPSPREFSYQQGYSDHTYENRSAPQVFDGFDLERIRRAVTLHRLGNFYESSAMMVALLGFAPVLAALQQAIAQILALPRHVKGGDRGLAKMVAAEVEEMIAPAGGLLPSPYLPPQLWGTMAIYLRMMGFCVLQHVDGDPDPETGIRERYTRIWEPWAVRFQRSPRRWIAITTEGEVEICNDGKFTLVIDENEGHLSGAIVALGPEVLGGKITQEARNGWLDFFGRPKLYATLPEKIQTSGPAGLDFEAAVETIYGPDGRGVLPFGSTLSTVALPGVGASQFREALYDTIAMIGMVLIGSNGTLTKEGVYTAPGYFDVRHDLIARPAAAMVRGINGMIAGYCDINYGEQIARAKKAGVWKYPVLGIDLPDPAQDARIASIVTAEKARCEILDMRKASGIETNQDDADKLAEDLKVRTVKLAATPPGASSFAYDQENGVITINQRLEELGKPLDETGRGDMTVPQYRAALAADVARAKEEAAAEAGTGGTVPNEEPQEAIDGTNEAPAGAEEAA